MIICKDNQPAIIGDNLKGKAKDGSDVEGVLVQGDEKNKTGILLPVGKIGQSIKDVGVLVDLAEVEHCAEPLNVNA